MQSERGKATESTAANLPSSSDLSRPLALARGSRNESESNRIESESCQSRVRVRVICPTSGNTQHKATLDVPFGAHNNRLIII